MALRIGVVGLGMAVKPHALGLKDLAAQGLVEVVACYSPTAERRAAFQQAYGLPVVEREDAVIGAKGVDAVLVLTPPNTHLDLVQRCAAAGQHVLLEKPVEVTSARARAIVEACEAAGVTLGIVLQHRFRPGAVRLAEILASGGLGRILSASANIRWWRDANYFAVPGRGMKARDGGGVLLTQAIHTLDLFLSLTGPVESVSAVARTSPLRSIDTEDIVAGALTFANGAIGALDATTVAYPGFPERIELGCEQGSARLEVEKLDVWFKDGRHEEAGHAAGGGGGADPMAFSHEYHRALIADFAEAVAERREPRISGRKALEVHKLIDALLAAAEAGKAVKV